MIKDFPKKDVRETITEALTTWNKPSYFFKILSEINNLQYILPDLENCKGVTQGENHVDDVFDHLMYCVDAGRSLGYDDLALQLGVLFHDIGKWKTRSVESGKIRFYKHEIVGATIAFKWMKHYEFDKKTTQQVVTLVRHHMFRFPLNASDKTVKHWLFEVGKYNWDRLLKLRLADRKGNRAKENKPLRTRAFNLLENQILRIIKENPVVFKEDLAISQKDISFIKDNLIKEVWPNIVGLCSREPDKNNKEYLIDYCQRVYNKEE